MRWFRLCYLRLYGLLFKKQVEQDIDEEMAFHIRMLASQRGAGEASEDAARSAARRFGRIEVIKDYCRDIRGGGVLDTVLGDLRYGLRSLGRNPGFAAVAISTLALGIGANTALFSVLNSVLLRPLPYTQPERLVSVQERDTIHGGRPTWISYPDFFDWRASSRSFDHIVGYRISSFNISLSGSPAHVGGAIVSWDLFPLLGMQPELGRGFTPEEEEPGHLAAVLSHELWQGTFGGDRDIIGKSITVGGRECSIVGVAPLGFRFPAQNRTAQLWTTIGFDAQVSEGQPITEQRGADLLEVTARLKPGVTFQQANDEMNTVAANLAERYPNTNRTVGGASVRPELERVVGANRQPLLILMGAVGLVLLIASANIANLLLARSVSRRQEMAIRAALGAARARVIGQLLTETLLLAFFGCVCGLLLAWLCLDELLPLAGNSLPRIADTTIDIRVLAFSVGVALIAALLSGSAPAVQASKVDLTESLKENGRGNVRGHDRLGGALIVCQAALSVVLLGSAALLVASFIRMQHSDIGVRPDHLLISNVKLPSTRYDDAHEMRFYDSLLERLRVLPGVESAAVGGPVPFTGVERDISFDIAERPAEPWNQPHCNLGVVTPGYFRTLAIPLIKGRDFTDEDTDVSRPVLVVNQAFASKYFPGEDAIGKRINPGATGPRGKVTCEIVGIVGNSKRYAMSTAPDPIYYFPYKQLPWDVGSIIVRTSGPPRTLDRAIQSEVTALDSQLPVYGFSTMEDLLVDETATQRFQTVLISGFAVLALVLTLVGIYGVISYSVTRRGRETGIRIALGAGRHAVVWMVVRQAALLVLGGVILGMAGSLFSTRLLREMLYGVPWHSTEVVVLAGSLIAVTGLFSAWLPARRLANIDPAGALKYE